MEQPNVRKPKVNFDPADLIRIISRNFSRLIENPATPKISQCVLFHSSQKAVSKVRSGANIIASWCSAADASTKSIGTNEKTLSHLVAK